MNTFKLTEENKAFIREIGEQSKILIDNYDMEVVAWDVGDKIINIVDEILEGKNNNIKTIKELAEDLIDSYDTEVIAWDVGTKIINIVDGVLNEN